MADQLQSLVNALSASSAGNGQTMSLDAFSLLLLVSLVSSLAIAYLYTVFYGSRATGSQVHRAFPLLGLSVTAIFICIQFSLPLSLGLLGALSIVRFRTPIKEPEEIGFIMVVIAVSIATATFQLAFVAAIFVAAIVALVAQRSSRLLRGDTNDGAIVVSLPKHPSAASPQAITDLVRRHAPRARLESVVHQENAIVLSYGVSRVTDGALVRLPDEVSAQGHGASCSVFFSRPNTW